MNNDKIKKLNKLKMLCGDSLLRVKNSDKSVRNESEIFIVDNKLIDINANVIYTGDELEDNIVRDCCYLFEYNGSKYIYISILCKVVKCYGDVQVYNDIYSVSYVNDALNVKNNRGNKLKFKSGGIALETREKDDYHVERNTFIVDNNEKINKFTVNNNKNHSLIGSASLIIKFGKWYIILFTSIKYKCLHVYNKLVVHDSENNDIYLILKDTINREQFGGVSFKINKDFEVKQFVAEGIAIKLSGNKETKIKGTFIFTSDGLKHSHKIQNINTCIENGYIKLNTAYIQEIALGNCYVPYNMIEDK